MSTGISANRMEILQIADAVAREKSIEKEIVIEAMEHALQKAAHTLKGSIGNFGAKKAFATAKELEFAGKEKDLLRAGELVPAMESELTLLVKQLGELIPASPRRTTKRNSPKRHSHKPTKS